MDRAAPAASGGASKDGRFRTGIKGLMITGAACALIIWGGIAIRDHLAKNLALHAIRSPDAAERQTAAQDLARDRSVDVDEAMASLLRTLRDGDAAVRGSAAMNLGVLISDLRGRPAKTPADMELVKKRADLATRALVSMLRSDQDRRVRAAAATGLGELARGPNPPRPTSAQLAALKVAPNTLRRKAAKRIYGASEAVVPPELVEAAQHGPVEVRVAAIRALARFGPDLDPEIPALFAMMEHGETKVRTACAGPLEFAWPTPSLVPELIGFLKSRDYKVRYFAALLLGRIGPEASEAIPDLITAMNEPFDASVYPDPAREAARALGQMGPTHEAIAALIKRISPENVERCLAEFGNLGNDGKASSDIPARKALRLMSAMEALGDIGPPAVEAVPVLLAAYKKALESHHSMASKTIPEALARIAPHSAVARDAVAALIGALGGRQYAPERVAAIEALGLFGTDATAAITKLHVLQNDSDNSVRNSAAKAVATLEAVAKPEARQKSGGDSH